MTDDPLDRVRERIETTWKLSGASPELVEAMRQILPGQAQKAGASQGSVRWIILPYLCCQAAGGDPRRADSLTAAWFLLLTAAHVMDKVQDQDPPDPSWAPQGPGAALSAATGLFFSACLCLNDLYLHDETRPAADGVISDFYAGFLRMSGGQHADLARPEPTLEEYWGIARDKSGAFFELACRCAARLGGASGDRLDGLGLYGQHLGILKQIRDDLEDIRPLEGARRMRAWSEVARSLPVVYALSVFPSEEAARLRLALQNAARDGAAAQEAFRLLENSGAGLYLSLEIDRQRDLAIEALRRLALEPGAAQPLIVLAQNLGIG